jgi:seryl-tRNA(Sec) selenium transferase
MLKELSVSGVINAIGSVTTFGESTPSEIVMDAIFEASRVYLGVGTTPRGAY